MNRKKVVIAGATGFIGRWLIESLIDDYDIIALSRNDIESDDPRLEWRTVDLFSVSSTHEAVSSADYAIYLVHSMLPSARLSQGNFEDNDLIIADNFSLACEAHGVRHIIYLSGILPKNEIVSEHLRSRFEVEKVLSSRSSALTTFRAGMVVGPQGSSFSIMEKLLRRLPVLILPAWAQTPSQAVSLERTIASIKIVLGKSEWFNRTIDLGSGETLSYAKMLRRCANYLKLKRLFITVPIRSTEFSKLWVSIVSKTPIELTSPLIDSLKYPIIPDLAAMKELGTFQAQSFETLLKEALAPSPLRRLKKISNPKLENNVRSIQRLPSFSAYSAAWIAREYLTWLPQFFRYIIHVKVDGDVAKFTFLNISLLILTHVKARSNSDRHLFFITGGVLCRRIDHGWLEFRQINQKRWTISAIHEFVPMLPWWLYRLTQAPLHAFVMRKFGKHLSRLSLSGKVV